MSLFLKNKLKSLHCIDFMVAFASNPTMLAIRNGLLLALPLVMAGSVAILLNNLPVPAYQETMLSLFGESWSTLGANIWRGTFGVLSLLMLFSISYHLVSHFNLKNPLQSVSPVIASLISFSSLIILMPIVEITDGEAFSLQLTGPGGLFVAIAVAIISTNLFLKLMRIRLLKVSLHAEGADTAIPQAFSALIPGILVLFIFSSIKVSMDLLGIDSLYALIHNTILNQFTSLKSTLESGTIYVVATQALWFIGIHGANVLDPVTHEFYEMIQAENISAMAAGHPAPYIVNKIFFDVFVHMGGSGSSICLLIALFIASKNNSSKRLAQMSIIPGLFNINEILLFGLPVILNPVFLIPFILVPLLLALNSYLFFSFGLVPPPVFSVEWTTPPLIGGYFSTGSVRGILLQCFNLALGTLCYIPFVRLSERLKMERFKIAMNGLMSVACGNSVGPSGKKCLDRDDEIGVLARALANDLEKAVSKNKGLFLEYQPQVEHPAGKVIGAEALIRWNHPSFGLIAPPIIIAIAEDGDLIDQIGLWVLKEAVAERKRWLDAGIDEVQMSINLSVRQLDDKLLPQKVLKIIRDYEVPIRLIELEVTESAALNQENQDNIVLSRIHDLGIRIAIDDFGMGHSSLLYLKHFPVSTLKLDRVLSKDVVHSKVSFEIITSIVDLCKAMKVDVVTEYVEDEIQLEILTRLGCSIFQGYYFSRPIKGNECLAYIQKYNQPAL